MTVRTDFEPGDVEPPRRYGRFAVLVALCVAGVSAAGLWTAWRIVGHHGGDGGIPIIRAEERPVKVPPANPGGMEVPDQDLYVLNHQQPSDSRVEQLLPPPEAPLPRPVAPPPTVAAAPPAPAVAPAETAAASPVAAPAIAPVASAPAAVAAPAANMAAVMPAAPPLTIAPPAAAAAGGYRLQVGAVRSPEVAQHEWARLKRAQADLLGSLDVRTVRVDLAGRGVFYRIEAGPIADGVAAQRACDTLKQRKVGCILVRP
jgi:hypothetical protein